MLSSASLGVGLVAPTVSIEPRAGEFTWLVELWDEEATETVTYSIVGAIGDLYQTNNLFLALVLGLGAVLEQVGGLPLHLDRGPGSGRSRSGDKGRGRGLEKGF